MIYLDVPCFRRRKLSVKIQGSHLNRHSKSPENKSNDQTIVKQSVPRRELREIIQDSKRSVGNASQFLNVARKNSRNACDRMRTTSNHSFTTHSGYDSNSTIYSQDLHNKQQSIKSIAMRHYVTIGGNKSHKSRQNALRSAQSMRKPERNYSELNTIKVNQYKSQQLFENANLNSLI
jgi:hypothetical protein